LYANTTLSPSPSPQARGTQNNLSYGEVAVVGNSRTNTGEGNVTTSGEWNEYMSLSNGEGNRERVKTNPFANVGEGKN